MKFNNFSIFLQIIFSILFSPELSLQLMSCDGKVSGDSCSFRFEMGNKFFGFMSIVGSSALHVLLNFYSACVSDNALSVASPTHRRIRAGNVEEVGVKEIQNDGSAHELHVSFSGPPISR